MVNSVKNPISPQELEKLGLSKTEARVYFHLLIFGPSYPSTIAQKTALTRTTCYRVLESLNRNSLIFKFKKDKKYFYEAAHPRNIRSTLQERTKKINQQLQQVENLLPGLTKLFTSSESLHNIEYYEGVDKYEQVLNDALNFPGETIYTFINIETLFQVMKGKDKIITKYVEQRIKSEIKNYSIIPKSQITFARKWLKEGYSKKYPTSLVGHYRYLDDDQINYSVYIRLYHDRIVFFDLESTRQTGVIIINQRLADTLKSIYKHLWKTAKPI